jgi:hypothetical protein
MNYTHNALPFHRGEIWPHHIVVRKIHYVGCREGTRGDKKKQNRALRN